MQKETGIFDVAIYAHVSDKQLLEIIGKNYGSGQGLKEIKVNHDDDHMFNISDSENTKLPLLTSQTLLTIAQHELSTNDRGIDPKQWEISQKISPIHLFYQDSSFKSLTPSNVIGQVILGIKFHLIPRKK